LTHEDEQIIARAIVRGLAKWGLYCFLAGMVIWLVWALLIHSSPE